MDSIADYRNALATLRSNKWYIAADKVAINLSDNFDNLVLSDFTGTREAVISSHQVDQLYNDFMAFQESYSSDFGKNSPTNFDEWL